MSKRRLISGGAEGQRVLEVPGRLAAVILAAGKGTRMNSERPKVLHAVAGRPMVCHVAQAAQDAGASPIVTVVGHGAELVQAALTARFGEGLRFAMQREQRGTGHAVKVALPALRDQAGDVLLLVGDMPLLRARTLRTVFRRSRPIWMTS